MFIIKANNELELRSYIMMLLLFTYCEMVVYAEHPCRPVYYCVEIIEVTAWVHSAPIHRHPTGDNQQAPKKYDVSDTVATK